MDKNELMKQLRDIFENNVQIYSRSEYRIECDVSTDFTREQVNSIMKKNNFIDNSKSINYSWKCGDITIIVNVGTNNSFVPKKAFTIQR